MPKVLRSPPSASKAEFLRVHSSPDIAGNINESDAEPAATNTNKRQRPNFSPDRDTESFENRIMNMLTSWKKEQDTILKRLMLDIKEVKQQNKDIQKNYTETAKWRDYMDKEHEDIKLQITKLEKEQMCQRNCILELEKKVQDLQNNSRSSAFEIRNVPSTENETLKDLTSILVNTYNCIQVEMDPKQLRDIYRLPGKKELNRPIVVELLSVPDKMKVIEAVRNFNKKRPTADKLNTTHIGIGGQLKPVYVDEHLPASTKQLFYEARNFAKLNNYKFCWFQNGKIFLREKEGIKPINIYSMSCLKKLQKPT